jgi:osmotically-inducible protein OsmY
MRIHERSRRSVSLALVLFLPLFLTSFAAKCDGNKNGNTNNTGTNTVPTITEIDDGLRSKIRENLTERSNNTNTGLSALDIEVGVSKRKVTLTGTVRSDAAKGEAKRVAEETEVELSGQKFKPTEVNVDRLTVTTPSPSP